MPKNKFRTFDTSKPTLHVLSHELLQRNNSDEEAMETASSSFDELGGWKGLTVPYSTRIRKQARKNWNDLHDDTSSCASSFVTPSTHETSAAPIFPGDDVQQVLRAQPDDDMQIAAIDDESSDDSNLSSPTASFVNEALPPCKDDQEADGDGAEAFEQDGEAQPHVDNVAGRTAVQQPMEKVTPEHQQPAYCYQNNPYYRAVPPAYIEPPYSGLRPYQPPPPPPPHAYAPQAPYSTDFTYEDPEEPQQFEEQVEGPAIPVPDCTVANHELIGWIPFIPYESMVNKELPNAAAVGAGIGHTPRRTAKFFCGHLWGTLSSACLQWLVNKFVPGQHRLFAPQLHFNKDGWFRGCLHVSVHSDDPQAIMDALHKRILFDHHGVWYAATDDQKALLEEYCHKLRRLSQKLRHSKLQSLPCNPIAVEIAHHE